MSRNVLKLAAALCVIALVACGVMAFGKTVHFGTHYENADKYTAGGATLTDAVKNLDIHWTSGEVSIAYHDKDTVEVSETSEKAISPDAALRWWLDGDTLRVQFTKSGYFALFGQKKALTVTLPEGAELGVVSIDATSADVNVPDLVADDIQVEITSGDLALKQHGASERVALHSTSGNVDAELARAGTLDVDVTSGIVRATLDSADEVSVATTSGDISLAGGEAGKVRVESTSGGIDVRLAAFDDARIEATSGNVTAALPTEPGYRADVHATSGRFDYTVALAHDGDTYTCGDGSAQLRIDTTSGNVLLKDANE